MHVEAPLVERGFFVGRGCRSPRDVERSPAFPLPGCDAIEGTDSGVPPGRGWCVGECPPASGTGGLFAFVPPGPVSATGEIRRNVFGHSLLAKSGGLFLGGEALVPEGTFDNSPAFRTPGGSAKKTPACLRHALNYPQTYFGSYSTPFFFKNVKNSSSKLLLR